MKKSIFTPNVVEKSIVGSKSAIARANKMMDPEYSELCELLEKHPTFKVAEKQINQKKDKKTYNGLSIKRMRDYISTQDSKEEKLVEFDAIVMVAEAKGAKYPPTKKWFPKNYPEFKLNEVEATEEAKNNVRKVQVKKAEEKKSLKELGITPVNAEHKIAG